jgi:hypothetical protein
MPLEVTEVGVSKEMQQAIIKSHNLEGICCSFAMDWLKKRLVGTTLDSGTYCSKSRMNKIAKRHKLQSKKTGIWAVAKAYSLKMSLTSSYRKNETRFAGEFDESGELGNFAYYVTCGNAGHGFAIDARDSKAVYLADSGSGVYKATSDMTAMDVLNAHAQLLNLKLVECFICTS